MNTEFKSPFLNQNNEQSKNISNGSVSKSTNNDYQIYDNSGESTFKNNNLDQIDRNDNKKEEQKENGTIKIKEKGKLFRWIMLLILIILFLIILGLGGYYLLMLNRKKNNQNNNIIQNKETIVNSKGFEMEGKSYKANSITIENN